MIAPIAAVALLLASADAGEPEDKDYPMPDEKFEPGDVVVLRGGGPMMTVVTQHGEGVFCLWFDVNGHLQRDTFKAVTLMTAKAWYGEPA